MNELMDSLDTLGHFIWKVATLPVIGIYRAGKYIVESPRAIKTMGDTKVRADHVHGLIQGALYHKAETRDTCIAKLKALYPEEYKGIQARAEADQRQRGVIV